MKGKLRMTQLANETGLTENQIMTWFDENKTGLQKFFNKEMSNELTKNSYFGTSGVRLAFKLVLIHRSSIHFDLVIASSS